MFDDISCEDAEKQFKQFLNSDEFKQLVTTYFEELIRSEDNETSRLHN